MKLLKKPNIYSILLLFIIVSCLISTKETSAKTIKGKCGRQASFTYNTNTKRLEISGKGSVDTVISVKKDLKKRTERFIVKSIVIGEGITTLQDSTILKYANSPDGHYTNVRIPNSFQKIPTQMFHSHIWIKQLNIPQNVKNIENAAFWNNYELKKITVSPKNPHYTSVHGILFTKDLSALIYYPHKKQALKYSVPSSVTAIAPLAFAGNLYLKEVNLPTYLKYLGAGAFFDCYKLEKTNIAQLTQLKKITDYNGKSTNLLSGAGEYGGVHHSYDQLDSQEDYIRVPGSNPRQYHGTFEGTALKSFTMPPNVKYIASETFRNCDYLQEMIIGKSFVGKINTGKPNSQKALSLFLVPLKSIKVATGNKKYITYKNGLYTKDKKILCQVFSDKRYLAFSNKHHAKSTYIISEKVSKIANGAFFRSAYNRIVTKGNLESVGYFAFTSSQIRTFNATGSIQKIKYGAFIDSKINDFQCKKSIYSIGNSAFEYSHLKSIQITSGLSVIKNRAFSQCDHLTKAYFPESLVQIDEYAFEGCSQLEKIYFGSHLNWGSNLKYVAANAFQRCPINDVIFRNMAIHNLQKSIKSHFNSWLISCQKLKPQHLLNLIFFIIY